MLILVPLFIVLLSAFLLWWSLSSLKRRRLLQDLPTSKTAGVFIGLVELKGTAESEAPLTGFLSEEPCVWYSWDISEQWSRTVTETYHTKDGMKTRTRTESGWDSVASGGETSLFYLQDDTGIIRIDPQKAEIHSDTMFDKTCTKRDPLYHAKGPTGSIDNSTGERHFTEKAIRLHKELYVVGQSHVRDDCVAAEIAHADDAKLFMISTKSEEQHHSSGHWGFWICGILFILIPLGSGIAVAQNVQDPLAMFGIPLAAGCGATLIWGIGLLWLVYNSLIELKNRVKMAAANIDVELKRRHDLIPSLVKTIEGLQQHERSVTETLALLRSQSLSKSTNDAAKGCAGHLIALAENYPQLKTDESFMKLHNNLVETEQRIALARGYYSDVIETYNNRRERWPECYVATLAGLQHLSPFIAEDFERAAVRVNLVQGK